MFGTPAINSVHRRHCLFYLTLIARCNSLLVAANNVVGVAQTRIYFVEESVLWVEVYHLVEESDLDILHELHLATPVRRIYASQYLQQRTLARAVWGNQCYFIALVYIERDVAK